MTRVAHISVAAIRACLEVRRQLVPPHPSIGTARRNRRTLGWRVLGVGAVMKIDERAEALMRQFVMPACITIERCSSLPEKEAFWDTMLCAIVGCMVTSIGHEKAEALVRQALRCLPRVRIMDEGPRH